MLDEKTRALLGDREAQERLTAAEVLLPCPFCGECPEEKTIVGAGLFYFECNCGKETLCYDSVKEARSAWNTRAPLLTPTQMALLGIAREPRKLEVDVNVDDT